jgi:hypothetical protein
MTGPRCIVCGRRIAKNTRSLRFERPWGTHVEGERAVLHGGYMVTVYLAERPRTRAEAQRYTNEPIISSKRGVDGTLSEVRTWDGESYRDPYFCTNRCAQQQGYAAAQHGHRFTWKASA